MNRRIAIVTHADLTNGEAANVAALLCGQISRMNPVFFAELPVIDQGGNSHAAPKFSVVILKAKTTGQLVKLAGDKTTLFASQERGKNLIMLFKSIGNLLLTLTLLKVK